MSSGAGGGLAESSLAKARQKRVQIELCPRMGGVSGRLGIHASLGEGRCESRRVLAEWSQIFPVSLFCALTSLTNIADFIPSLKSWIDAHPDAASTITSLGPVVLVASLTLSICPILLLIANKAETINTRLGIHNSVLERFWKFCKSRACWSRAAN